MTKIHHIPAYRTLWNDILDILEKQRSLGIISIQVKGLNLIETTYGSKVYDTLCQQITKILYQMEGKLLRNDDCLTRRQEESDMFLVFLSQKRNPERLARDDLEVVADRLYIHLNPLISEILAPYIRDRAQLSVGYGVAVVNPLVDKKRLIYRTILEAEEMAQYQLHRWEIKSKQRLKQIIATDNIQTLFQPIADIENRVVIGYEALSRGPVRTEFERPEVLFDRALKSELMFELDRTCRLKALQSSKALGNGHRLFLNTHPSIIHDSDFKQTVKKMMDAGELPPAGVVLELTERLAIQNYPLFREALKLYTDAGFKVAIDDVGAGYSSLEVLAELKPDYVKLDISLIRNVHKNIPKQEMLRAMVAMTHNLGVDLIAEGIETIEELQTLQALGVTLCQGFLLGTPSNKIKDVDFDKHLSQLDEASEQSDAVT